MGTSVWQSYVIAEFKYLRKVIDKEIWALILNSSSLFILIID